MYNVYVKRNFFYITEIGHMKRKQGQVSALRKKRLKSRSHSVTPLLDTPSGAGLGVSHVIIISSTYKRRIVIP